MNEQAKYMPRTGKLTQQEVDGNIQFYLESIMVYNADLNSGTLQIAVPPNDLERILKKLPSDGNCFDLRANLRFHTPKYLLFENLRKIERMPNGAAVLRVEEVKNDNDKIGVYLWTQPDDFLGKGIFYVSRLLSDLGI